MISDSHTHSAFSFDGHDSVAEMCRIGVKNGVSAFSVTDHCDIDGILDGFYPPYRPESGKAAVLEAREHFRGKIEIAWGVELGQPHLRREESLRILKEHRYDFVIGSVHNLEKVPDFAFLHYADMPQTLIDSLFRRNLEELSAVAAFPGVSTLAHVTYPRRYARLYGREIAIKDFTEEFRALFRIMTEKGVALELNSKMLREGQAEPDPSSDVLTLYRECGGELVTVGSDAHFARDIGGSVEDAYELLRTVGFRYVSYAAEGGIRQMKL